MLPGYADVEVTAVRGPEPRRIVPWREVELWLALALAIGVFCLRLSVPNLRGEEPRRGLVAIEMLRTGDFVTPRQQGTLFLSRPPLQNWLIAAIGAVRGQVDAIAIRLPSALATVLTVGLIYLYGRTFLTRGGSLAAALAYGTCGQVLELGKLGETEALFVLVVAASLTIWHYGFTRDWPAWLTWSLPYTLVAIGVLTKGPQAPVYFAGAVGLYLLACRRWKYAFSLSHFCGVLVFFIVWSAWQVPYYLQHGLENSLRMYSNDVGLRFSDTSWLTIASHLVIYPLEILVCLLPWSGALAVFLFPGFWRTLGPARQPVLFACCCLAIAFPSCWLVPGAKVRYFMPLFPSIALLSGLAVQRCWEADQSAFWHGTWRRFATVLAAVMIALPATLAVTTWLAPSTELAQPPAFALAFLALSAVTAVVVYVSREATSDTRRRLGVVSVGAFLGLAYTGAYTNYLNNRSNDTEAQIAELSRQMPLNTELVSFGLINHLFSYYYPAPIEPWDAPSADATFFCVSHSTEFSPPLVDRFDFTWEPVATIVCDRYRRDSPRNVVVVGRIVEPAGGQSDKKPVGGRSLTAKKKANASEAY